MMKTEISSIMPAFSPHLRDGMTVLDFHQGKRVYITLFQ